MADNPPGEQNRRPTDELGDELRRAVEAIVRDEPPEELVLQTLDGLRTQKPSGTRWTKRWFRLVGGLAAVAASVAALALVWRARSDEGHPPQPGPSRPVAGARGDLDDRLPTLWAYRQAAFDSPEALNAMLDEHAARLLPADPKFLRMRGFSGLAPEVL